MTISRCFINRAIIPGKIESSDKWLIKDGVFYIADASGEAGDIVTRKEYENFEMKIDWKVGKILMDHAQALKKVEVVEANQEELWELVKNMEKRLDAVEQDESD